jgi:nucleoside-diphosphate-sugar epimerase
MEKYKNIVFGSSSLIGVEITKYLNTKKTIFTSRKFLKNERKINWKKIDLNKDSLKVLPKKIEKIFFLASPYYNKKNLNNPKIFEDEFKWIKKILNYFEFDQIIYISSSSVYYKESDIGKVKINIENFLKKKKIKYLQIWRPFNLLGAHNHKISDHFHNLLLKNKKNSLMFNGNPNSKRGYSSVKKFTLTIFNHSKLKKSFVLNYRNKNMLKVVNIVKIYNKILKERKIKILKYEFKKMDDKRKYLTNLKDDLNVKTIYSKENSEKILIRYFRENFQK